jgi:hypothetical protein
MRDDRFEVVGWESSRHSVDGHRSEHVCLHDEVEVAERLTSLLMSVNARLDRLNGQPPALGGAEPQVWPMKATPPVQLLATRIREPQQVLRVITGAKSTDATSRSGAIMPSPHSTQAMGFVPLSRPGRRAVSRISRARNDCSTDEHVARRTWREDWWRPASTRLATAMPTANQNILERRAASRRVRAGGVRNTTTTARCRRSAKRGHAYVHRGRAHDATCLCSQLPRSSAPPKALSALGIVRRR